VVHGPHTAAVTTRHRGAGTVRRGGVLTGDGWALAVDAALRWREPAARAVARMIPADVLWYVDTDAPVFALTSTTGRARTPPPDCWTSSAGITPGRRSSSSASAYGPTPG